MPDYNETQIVARLHEATIMARRAGELTLEYFQKGVAIEHKEDGSPVTVADREAEQLLRREIARLFPNDEIIGEEFADAAGTTGYRWILDPIDGTKSFISGVPLYGTLVGVEFGGDAVVGVVFIPGLDEMVYAATGQGAWHIVNGAAPTRAKVNENIQDLSDGLFVTTQLDTFAARGAEDVYVALEKQAYITRTWGDCYGYVLVATGRAAVMVDPILNVWDAAAVKPIIVESGGAFVDWQGASTIRSGDAIGTTPGLLNQVLKITKTAEK
ncbi:MAG TPA: inositol monophosphatase family protein [Planctomycetes bacterium]|jgi:histidinol phosphatase-like enzyme (inositol monophosphatase family)|nr:inositol monophosphatase family protein [Planctomycetaceae bacterium]HIM31626.1 inositol monophosphatase family protein [Planctomycetota bacterium]